MCCSVCSPPAAWSPRACRARVRCSYGAGLALTGIAFATVGGLAAQLTESAGGARGIGLGVLGLAFALRLAGDAGGPAAPVGAPSG